MKYKKRIIFRIKKLREIYKLKNIAIVGMSPN